MDINQIAHDLAVAKSVKDGSDAKEIVRLYHEYNEKFLNILEPKQTQTGSASATQNPLWARR